MGLPTLLDHLRWRTYPTATHLYRLAPFARTRNKIGYMMFNVNTTVNLSRLLLVLSSLFLVFEMILGGSHSALAFGLFGISWLLFAAFGIRARRIGRR